MTKIPDFTHKFISINQIRNSGPTHSLLKLRCQNCNVRTCAANNPIGSPKNTPKRFEFRISHPWLFFFSTILGNKDGLNRIGVMLLINFDGKILFLSQPAT